MNSEFRSLKEIPTHARYKVHGVSSNTHGSKEKDGGSKGLPPVIRELISMFMIITVSTHEQYTMALLSN
ncbi:hypothetical protein LSM04_008460 [Trypanosoma melophagium]|uniref:uncharacterized protein n=1 Tax=Trypanosoma melophagium TaxID=715481 RepID=UPI00351A4420|nr:hypothetical protein LSM04_008460 [Trypanosoma melophagium]